MSEGQGTDSPHALEGGDDRLTPLASLPMPPDRSTARRASLDAGPAVLSASIGEGGGGEKKKRRNAEAQLNFRKRKKDYIDQLEASLVEAGQHLEHLVRSRTLASDACAKELAQTVIHRKANEEAGTLRRENMQLHEKISQLEAEIATLRKGGARSTAVDKSPTLAPAHVEEDTSMQMETGTEKEKEKEAPSKGLGLSLADLEPLSYLADDFNLYAEVDAPLSHSSRVYAPIHSVWTGEGASAAAASVAISPSIAPSLTFSPASAASEPMPSTPPTATFSLEPDWISPDARPSVVSTAQPLAQDNTVKAPQPTPTPLHAWAPSLEIDPDNQAQLRASSLPTKSAKCTAQLQQMRKLVAEAEIDRLEMGLGVRGL